MIRRLLPLACLLAVSASAVVVEVNLPYKELRLKDGMLFTDVAVKSFNTSAGTVILQANKELISLRTSLLPADVSARLQELTPQQSKEEQSAEKLQEAADRKKAAENAERRQKMAEEDAQAARAASRNLNVKVAEHVATKADNTLETVAKFAEERAHAYFNIRTTPTPTSAPWSVPTSPCRFLSQCLAGPAATGWRGWPTANTSTTSPAASAAAPRNSRS